MVLTGRFLCYHLGEPSTAIGGVPNRARAFGGHVPGRSGRETACDLKHGGNVDDAVREALVESARLKERLAHEMSEDISRAAGLVVAALRGGGKVLIFGNGGSAADAQHIACELVGFFTRERPAWPAIALTTDTSVMTSVSNDLGYEQVFARQIEALAQAGDVAIAISTSGNSPNIVAGARTARERGCTVIGLTGAGGGKLAAEVDLNLAVPSKVTPRIQDAHITIGHIICGLVEDELAGPKGPADPTVDRAE